VLSEEERIAIKEALNALRRLISETPAPDTQETTAETQEQEEDIA
jgi:hypothetical protein